MGKALIIKGADFSQVAVDTIDIVVGQPTISIDLLGNVTITSPNGEDIYYTTDGSTPTNASTKYTSGFSVQMNTTVKAVCYYGGNYSEVALQLYDGTLQAPTISISNAGVVTITATDNASIRYTIDGQTNPTSSVGTEYTEPFAAQGGTEVRAIAYVTDGGTTISSSVATAEVPEGFTYGKKVGFNSILDDENAVLSPKLPVDGGTAVYFYYKATGTPNVLGEFTANGSLNDVWNAQNSSPRPVTIKSNTTYLRFSCGIGSSFAGTGVKYTYNGEEHEFYYDGSPAPTE